VVVLSIKKPKQKRSKVTVDSILEASKIVIKKSGLEKFNTNYIAEVAGVSIGSLYQYFKNKESILKVLLDRELEKNRESLDKLIDPNEDYEIEEVVEKIVGYFIDNWEEKGVLGKILFQFVPDIIDFSLFKSVDKKLIPLLKEKIELSNKPINQENIDYALFLIINNVRTIVYLINTHYQEYDKEIIKKELATMISSYLKVR
jgi:AcrR family transcriptional regulator